MQPQRQKRENVKARIIRERGFKNIRLASERVAGVSYRPARCKKTCRLVILEKNLSVERGENALFDDKRYFFYITTRKERRPTWRFRQRHGLEGFVKRPTNQSNRATNIAASFSASATSASRYPSRERKKFSFVRPKRLIVWV